MIGSVSALKSRAFQTALLLAAISPSFAAQPAAPANVKVDGVAAIGAPAPAAQTVFDCNTSNFFYTTGTPSTPCAVGASTRPPNGFGVAGSNGNLLSVEKGVVYLTPPGNGGHVGTAMIYQQKVNVQAFTANFTFIPTGLNIAFVLQNDTSNHYGVGLNGRDFSAGAGAEAGFYQAFDKEPVNNIFALLLDGYHALTKANPYTFTYSSAQIYWTRVSPQIPAATPSWTDKTQTTPDKISTYPVPLNSPANKGMTTTGHTYSATVTYDGKNVTLNLYDVTAGGSCPGDRCFTYTWKGVDIPALVGGNTAWVGLSGGCNSNCQTRLNVSGFSYKNP